MPRLSLDTDEILGRLRELENAGACEHCETLTAHAVTDIKRLLKHVNWLYTALGKQRMRAANYEAAIRAALGAANDGEADPLAYLRDETGDDAYGA